MSTIAVRKVVFVFKNICQKSGEKKFSWTKSITFLSILLVNMVTGAFCMCLCVSMAGVVSLCIRWCPLKVAVSVGEALQSVSTTIRKNQPDISAEINIAISRVISFVTDVRL